MYFIEIKHSVTLNQIISPCTCWHIAHIFELPSGSYVADNTIIHNIRVQSPSCGRFPDIVLFNKHLLDATYGSGTMLGDGSTKMNNMQFWFKEPLTPWTQVWWQIFVIRSYRCFIKAHYFFCFPSTHSHVRENGPTTQHLEFIMVTAMIEEVHTEFPGSTYKGNSYLGEVEIGPEPWQMNGMWGEEDRAQGGREECWKWGEEHIRQSEEFTERQRNTHECERTRNILETGQRIQRKSESKEVSRVRSKNWTPWWLDIHQIQGGALKDFIREIFI